MTITFEFPKDFIPNIPVETLLMNTALVASLALVLWMVSKLYFNMKG